MNIKNIIIASALIFTFLAVPATAGPINNPPAQGSAIIDPCQDQNVANTELCRAAANGESLFGPNSIWNRILNALTFAVGAIAVLMMILGAIRYAVSGGEQAQVTSAKNTIIYAAVALVVAVMANAIVNFVLTNI
jgi:hypothetical protein